ncbi:MAG: cell filamentation protein Fic [Flavobacteriaceae bacterium]|nr:MAG: cell filamentation protein Fic [Flavobacteriaceae bacterium]
MSTPSEKLAASLKILHDLQEKNNVVAIKASQISRTHKERLIKNGFLKEVTKGWYISSNPNEIAGDSTSWYTSYWQFCIEYLQEKYEGEYCISAEQSILIHAGNNTVPTQLIVRAPKTSNTIVELLYDTSLLAMKSPLPKTAELIEINGIRMLALSSALIHCSPTMYHKNPNEVRLALAQVIDSSEILEQLLDGSHSVIAGRLAGAFRNIGQTRIANDIIKAMKSADYDIREIDPFENTLAVALSFRERSPYANRIKLMWQEYREVIIKYFPEEPKLPISKEKYLKAIDEIYKTDAYHSLSIERYIVSIALIEKVKGGKWNTNTNEEDRKQRNAMAARGYWQASIAVKNSISKILNGENSGKVVNDEHQDWYRELFAPSVASGLLKPSDLAGYRTNQVYISQSKHAPLNKDALRDAIPMLFELLESEQHSGVRAVLGHFIFVYIHPYMDGNGRMGRFLMNTMFASGGYPWTVIPVEERDNYMKSLEIASVEGNIEPFAKFISNLVDKTMKGIPVAKIK